MKCGMFLELYISLHFPCFFTAFCVFFDLFRSVVVVAADTCAFWLSKINNDNIITHHNTSHHTSSQHLSLLSLLSLSLSLKRDSRKCSQCLRLTCSRNNLPSGCLCVISAHCYCSPSSHCVPPQPQPQPVVAAAGQPVWSTRCSRPSRNRPASRLQRGGSWWLKGPTCTR